MYRSTLQLVVLFLLSFLSTVAAAQEAPQRTVVLEVANGGTDFLVAELGAISVVELRDQGWFLEQVRERQIRAKKLLTRPKDLRFVMSGSNISWVVHVDHEGGVYSGRIFDAEGELASQTDLGAEFGQVEAAEMRAAFEKLLGIEAEVVEAIEVTPEEVGASNTIPIGEPEVVGEKKEARKERPPREPGDGGLSLDVAARFFKRDMTFAGSNNAVLNYESAFYPGFGLALEYVFGGVQIGPGLFGIGLDVSGGFDSVNEASILHLDGALAAALHFDLVDIRLGARHVRYSVSDASVFPSLAHTLVLLGLGASQELGPVSLGGDVEVYPWGTYGGTGKAFGESNSEIGFAARLLLDFSLSDTFGIAAGYGFRLGRASFRGNGTADFIDSRGFELVHGPELGITWHP